MKRSIFTVIALALTIQLPVAARATTSTRYAERSDQVVSAAGVKGLDIENPRGLVQVRPSSDGKIHVTAIKLVRMQRHADARKYADLTSVETRSEQGRWVVRVKYPKRIEAKVNLWELFTTRGNHDLGFPLIEVQIVIEAPPALTANIRTVSGDVDVQGLAGALSLHSTSGDVTVRDAAAVEASTVSGALELQHVQRVQASSTSGDISAEDTGALSLSTTSGTIEVAAPRDTVRLTSVSGDIQTTGPLRGIAASTSSGEISVESSSGAVRLSSLSGDIQAGLTAPLGPCTIKTTSGAVTVEVSPGLNAKLDFRTTSGEMECSVPVRLQSQSRNNLSAILGKGGALVVLQTVSGDINLTSGGN